MRLTPYYTSFTYIRSTVKASPRSFFLATKSLDSCVNSLTWVSAYLNLLYLLF